MCILFGRILRIGKQLIMKIFINQWGNSELESLIDSFMQHVSRDRTFTETTSWNCIYNLASLHFVTNINLKEHFLVNTNWWGSFVLLTVYQTPNIFEPLEDDPHKMPIPNYKQSLHTRDLYWWVSLQLPLSEWRLTSHYHLVAY